MFCTKCGKEIAKGAKFCIGCGAPVGEADTQRNTQASMQTAAQPTVQTAEQPTIQPVNRQSEQPVNSRPVQSIVSPQETDKKNRRVALTIFLGVLLLAGVMAAAGHFTADGSKDGEKAAVEQPQTQTQAVEEKTPETAEQTSETVEQTPEAAQQTPTEGETEPEKVTSETNEVVQNRILDNVPKAVCAYDFEEDIGSAQTVVRNGGEQMPETVDIRPQYVEGVEGEALYLNGTYGLRLAHVGRIGESYTVAFWIRADALYDWSPFIHIGYNLLDPDRRCRLWIGQKTEEVSVAPILSSEQARDGSSFEIRSEWMEGGMQPGVWYHIVFTVDGTRNGSRPNSVYGALYVSGVRVGEGDVARDVMNADDPEINLGINCWDDLFPAAYDGVKVWNRALDESQVAELYNAYYQ